MSAVYNIKSTPEAGKFVITKFDDDMNVESSYEFHNITDGQVCYCPSGQRPTCRHRQMFPMLQTRVDSPWFLDFDTRQWVDPTGEAKLDEFEMKALGTALSQPEPEPAATPLRTTIEGNPTSESQRESFLRSSGLAPRDDHPFRRRM